MRMWMVDTKLLCRKHLLGEHSETHMMVGTLRRNISIDGYLEKGLFEMDKIKQRHDKLAEEINIRGYNHNSPLPNFIYNGKNGKINVENNIIELQKRCEDCKRRIKNGTNYNE